MRTRLTLVNVILCSAFGAGCVLAGASAASPGDPIPQAPATATPWPAQPPPVRPIYIVDPNGQGVLSRILMVDPDQPEVARTITTRFLPDLAISADGQRLYVADSYRAQVTRGEQRDVMSVYDALSGELLVDDIPVPQRLLYKGFPLGDPFVFLSEDERHLYVMKYGEADIQRLRLSVLDPSTLQMLHEGDWPTCGHRLRVRSGGWLCANGVSLDVIDPLRGTVIETLLAVPGGQVTAWLLAANGERLYVSYAGGALVGIDLPARDIVATGRLRWNASWQVVWGSALLSPDGARLYLGFDTGDDDYQVFADAIAVYATATGERLAAIELPDSVTQFALSAEGDQLYAVSPFAQSLAIFDTTTFQVLDVMSDLGGAPAAIVVPSAGR